MDAHGEKRSRALGCGGSALLLAFALLTYLGWANLLPPPEPAPVRAYPKPNGYDASASAVSKLSGVGGPEADTPWTAEIGALRRAMVGVRPGLKELRAAVRLPFLARPGEEISSAPYRHACRLMAAESRIQLADGKADAAMDTALDIIELGVKFGRGGSWSHTLYGSAFAALGLRSAAPLVEELTASETGIVLARLDRVMAQLPEPTEVMEEERRQVASDLRAFFGKPGHPMDRMASPDSEPEWLFNLRTRLAGVFYPRSWGNHRIDEYQRALVHELGKPINQRVPPSTPTDPVLGEWVSFEDYQFPFTQPRAHLRLLRTQLALREYRLRSGRYPASLHELFSGPLPEAALDPFTETPLLYRRAGAGYLLYSVGPDAHDDGGTPSPNASVEAKGDLVAGHLYPTRTPRKQ